MTPLDERRPAAGSTARDRRRWPSRPELTHDAMVIVALWGLAVVQPVLDLFGRNPEFFTVNDVSRAELVGFALAVTLLGPVVLLAVVVALRLLGPEVGAVGRSVVIGLLGGTFVLAVVVDLTDDTLIALAVAAFLGAVIAHLEATNAAVRSGLRYLSAGPLLFLAAFFFVSESGDLLAGEDGVDVEAGVVGRPAPIVVLSLDEFPVSSLLRPDGSLDTERFPNFGRLAASSTWYRNATSVSPNTIESVPAMLTGVLPEAGLLPEASDHPRSLFTLLGDEYDQNVHEQVTRVCPVDICPSDATGFDLGRLRTVVSDAAAVYANAVAPEGLRDHLPRVDQSWGDFLGDEANVESAAADPDAAAGGSEAVPVGSAAADIGPDPDCDDIDLWCGPARVSEMIESIGPTEDPTLWMVHATFPHAPWITGRTGQQYAPRTLEFPGRTADGQWVAENDVVRQGLQRHLLQVGAMDRLVGDMIDRLEDAGLWDEALVVVTADHGVAFTPGAPLRRPVAGTEHEIYNVPLFIKGPGQSEGRVHRGNALNLDVLPTIVDLLEIEVDWEFDGQSLVGDERHRGDKPVVDRGAPTFAPTDFEGVLDVVRRNRLLLPHGDGWDGVLGIGRHGALMGTPVGQLELTAAAVGASATLEEAGVLADWDPTGPALAPILLHGRLRGVTTVPADALIAVNGTVAAGVVDFEATDDGDLSFSALIDEELLVTGANEVRLLLPAATGTTVFQEVPIVS